MHAHTGIIPEAELSENGVRSDNRTKQEGCSQNNVKLTRLDLKRQTFNQTETSKPIRSSGNKI